MLRVLIALLLCVLIYQNTGNVKLILIVAIIMLIPSICIYLSLKE